MGEENQHNKSPVTQPARPPDHQETCSAQPNSIGELLQRQCLASSPVPMASLTRSTRRAEGFSPHVNGDAALTRPGAVAFPPGRRPKRAPDAVEHGLDAVVSKKSKTTSELIGKQPPNAQAPISRPAAVVARSAPPHGATTTTAARATATATATQNASAAVTKHQAKVINGIKAELDRLEPQAATSREPGRKLRSQEATRFKSELSAYFPDYDEVIGNDPKEECESRNTATLSC